MRSSSASVTLDRLNVGDPGQGTLNIFDGALVTLNDATLGNNNSGYGTIHVGGFDSTLNVNGAITVGNQGWGSLNIDGGDVSSSLGTVGLDFNSVGRVAVDFGGTWAVSNDLNLGFAGAGELDVRAGSQTTVGGNALLGSDVSGDGRVTVHGLGARWDVDGDLTLADKGSATIEITAGGTLSDTAATLATNFMGSATVLVDGIGSIWDNGGTLTLGSEGQGTMIVSAGAAVENTSATLGGIPFGSADVTIAGAGSRWTNSGSVRIGDAGDAVLNVLDGASFSSAAANIAYQDDSDSTVTVDGVGTTWTSTSALISGRNGVGQLTVTGGAVVRSLSGVVSLSGTSASFAGFAHEGTLNVGGNVANLLSAGYAQLGRLTTLAGGTIHATHGIALGTGDVLDGYGTVNGKVAAAVGSIIQESAGATLTLGDATAFDGFVSAGTLMTQAGSIELLDRNQATLGALTSLIGDASLVAANGLVLNFGSAMTGFGEVDTPNDPTKALINNGDIVGDSPAELITLSGYVKGAGTLDNVDITGTDAPGFSPAAVNRGSVSYNGTLEIEIGGTTPGSSFDQLNHILGAGIADLGGILDVKFINNFTPSAGDTFEIITATSVVDTFDTLNLPSLPDDLQWFVHEDATTVELVATYGADFQEDGDVDAMDLARWKTNFGSINVSHMQGDANADGIANGFDFLTWQRQYGNGVTAGAAAATVPEPTSFVVVLVGLLMGVGKRGQIIRLLAR